jgi:hypothetical protein
MFAASSPLSASFQNISALIEYPTLGSCVRSFDSLVLSTSGLLFREGGTCIPMGNIFETAD